MAIEIKHATQATGTPAGNGEIADVEWNEAHNIEMGTGRLVGRTTGGTGDAEEIEVTDGLSFAAGVLKIAKATAANIRARLSNAVLTADNIASAKAAVALTYSATRSLVWTDGWYRKCTLTGNMTLSNPTSVEENDIIKIRLVGNNSTERSISFGTNYKGNLPDVTVTSTRAIMLYLDASSTTEIVVSYVVIE